ncbi:MAG: hypothetical protein AAF206_16510, partial [Bacteroidota bacterium]
MKRFAFLFCILIPSFLLQSLQGQAPKVEGEVIVVLKPEASISQLLRRPLQGRNGPVGLESKKQLSKRLNIYLLSYPPDQINEEESLLQIGMRKEVQMVQFNHLVEARTATATTPDDALFASQWALNNTGQSGGNTDADVDAPEAWDISTGGATAFGDTVVIAIIDGGIDLDHEDLPLFKNR